MGRRLTLGMGSGRRGPAGPSMQERMPVWVLERTQRCAARHLEVSVHCLPWHPCSSAGLQKGPLDSNRLTPALGTRATGGGSPSRRAHSTPAIACARQASGSRASTGWFRGWEGSLPCSSLCTSPARISAMSWSEEEGRGVGRAGWVGAWRNWSTTQRQGPLRCACAKSTSRTCPRRVHLRRADRSLLIGIRTLQVVCPRVGQPQSPLSPASHDTLVIPPTWGVR